ncbi:MAG: AMP-binding protein, partial [Alphaproteobacteria bacterium]|nr:AMP-binding protein [Alphaproteobacteria bacterium]
MGTSAHIDRFVLDHLPLADQQPELIFDRPELAYPERLNAGVELLRRAIAAAGPDARALIDSDHEFSWARVDAISGRMARVLVEDMGLVPGNRVLLHGPNSSWTVLAWFAILKAGGVVVATMPMLRPAELATVIDKARISHALVYASLAEAVTEAQASAPSLKHVMDSATLQAAALSQPAGASFDAVNTAADDPALIAFTSGTTG